MLSADQTRGRLAMNKKFLLSTVVLFVLSMILDVVIHAVLLNGDYSQLPQLYRTEQAQMGYFHWMLLAHLMIAAAFVWIYQQGRTDKPWLGQGIRFGIAAALLMTVPNYLIYYAVMPLPGVMVAKQVIFGAIGVVIMGITVAWLNRQIVVTER